MTQNTSQSRDDPPRGADMPTPSPGHDRHHSAQQLGGLSHLVTGDVTGTTEASSVDTARSVLSFRKAPAGLYSHGHLWDLAMGVCVPGAHP